MAQTVVRKTASAEKEQARLPRLRLEVGEDFGKRAALYAAVALIAFWSLAPFLWLVVLSFSEIVDIVTKPPRFLPIPLKLINYQTLFFPQSGLGGYSKIEQVGKMPSAFVNSAIVAIGVSLLCLVIGSVAAYAYARYQRYFFHRATFFGLIMTRMIPGLTLSIPFFIFYKALGLLDTKLGLIIAYSSFLLPLTIWIMKGYIEGIPISLERAAMVDGCTRLQSLFKVILPVCTPGMIAAGIFVFMAAWNEFYFALILTSTQNAQTMPVVLAGFAVHTGRVTELPTLFAGSVVGSLPPLILALVFQRFIVQGLLVGASKG